jgi:glycosyltransferase involved in cell wall biosynthesis
MGSVGIVTPSFHPMIGGVEFYVRGIGTELARLGYDVHVYTPNKVMRKKIDPEEEVIDGVHVHRLDVWFEVSYRVKLWRGLQEALQRTTPDLIHVYSHDSYARPAAKAAGKLGRPLLITTYGPFETHSDYGAIQSRLFRLYDSYVTPSLFRDCAVVLARYPEILEWVRSFGVADTRARLEPSGIPQGYLAQAGGRRGREIMGHDGELILYLGRISPQKGVQYAVEAMQHVKKRFPRAKLVIVGPDYVGYSDHLRELAANLGVTENIAIMEAVTTEEDEVELLSACDVFVMPSSFEGFSQSVMKAMAQSRPVLVTNVGGLPYEIDYGRCGLACEFGDATKLADGLVSLLDSPELALTLGANGRKRAEEFTFERLASRLSDTYRSTIYPGEGAT